MTRSRASGRIHTFYIKKNRRFQFWQVEVWKRDGWTMWTKNNNEVFSTTVTENVKYRFSLLLENTTAKHKNENWSKGLTQDTNDSTSIKIWISPFKTLSGDLKHLIKTCLQSILFRVADMLYKEGAVQSLLQRLLLTAVDVVPVSDLHMRGCSHRWLLPITSHSTFDERHFHTKSGERSVARWKLSGRDLSLMLPSVCEWLQAGGPTTSLH